MISKDFDKDFSISSMCVGPDDGTIYIAWIDETSPSGAHDQVVSAVYLL